MVVKSKSLAKIFVVQKHNASHLHYDFRLELDGVLKSWAVPKGMPKKSGEKRLAVQTEDHPLEYAKFVGTIPKGEYGAGVVEIWDSGFFKNKTKKKDGNEMEFRSALRAGKAIIYFEGKKLKGIYYLLRTKMDGNTKNWLLIKSSKK